MSQQSPGRRASALLEALGGDQFLSSSLGQAFVAPCEAGHPPEIYSLARLLQIVHMGVLEPPRIRMFRETIEVPPADWLRRAVTRRNTTSFTPAWSDLSSLLARGATLVVDRVNELDSDLADISLWLSMALRERVQVNAYYTTGESRGFPPHWDDHEVIVYQLLGEKEWTVFGEARAKPMWRDADQSHKCPETVRWRGSIKAGQIMYVPRGHWHEAKGTKKNSLHLTIGFTRRTGIDWFEWLVDQLRSQEAFRSDLPVFDSSAGLAATGQRLLVEALDHLSRSQVADYLGRTNVGTAFAPRPFVDAPDIEWDSKATVYLRTPAMLEDGTDGNFHMISPRKRLTLRANARFAIQLLLEHIAVPASEWISASELPENQALALFEALKTHAIAGIR